MKEREKYNRILDSLQGLLTEKNIQSISVSEIARQAGMGKGSIYYYFPSKDAIVDVLVERSYQKPLEKAKQIAGQTGIPPFTKMAMLFEACHDSSAEYLKQGASSVAEENYQEKAYFHQKFQRHLIEQLKPVLTEIISQGIECGQICFDYPEELAEIVLIVLSVKIDNTLIPSSREQIENTIRGLISLLEKGTENPVGSLNFLTML